LELKSSRSFLAIKRCQRTKIGKVIKLAQSSKKSGHISVTIVVKLLIRSVPLIFLILHYTLDAYRLWWHEVLQNRYTMSNITPPNGTPKDVNNGLRGATGLDPDNPNDMVFKLVTILYFFVSQILTYFFRTAHTYLPPPFASHSRVVSQCATSTSVLASLA
jgi:hypothetical protein